MLRNSLCGVWAAQESLCSTAVRFRCSPRLLGWDCLKSELCQSPAIIMVKNDAGFGSLLTWSH